MLVPAVLAMAGFIALPFILKAQKRQRAIPTWITRQGVEVFAGDLDVDEARIEDAIGAAMGWWMGHAPGKSAAITKYISECSLYLVPKGPLVMPNGSKANGYTQGHVMTAWCNEHVVAIVQHEVGHACLNAMGYSGDLSHHARMAEAGFPWS